MEKLLFSRKIFQIQTAKKMTLNPKIMKVMNRNLMTVWMDANQQKNRKLANKKQKSCISLKEQQQNALKNIFNRNFI